MNTSSSVSAERSPILRLPEEVINQIAAGEVIERPASIVKELIENSLDAGATRVDIFLENGGIDELRVVDDGSGILLEELPLAVQRHATSKLTRPEDLFLLESFGFRGEALSSICSVADVEITSRTGTSASAYRACFPAGEAGAPVEYLGAPLGTQVKVRNLFKNVPGRRKFLRSPQTELSHCQTILKEIALAHPEMRFSLHHNQRLLNTYSSHQLDNRFLECLKLKGEVFSFVEAHDHMALHAFFAPAHISFARAELYLFINKRPVRNRNFISAIRTAYKEFFTQEPVGVCFLEIRKDWVDVNVHPQKWEVRCLEQASIYHWLLLSLRKHFASTKTPSAVAAAPLIPGIQKTGPSKWNGPSFQKPLPVPAREPFVKSIGEEPLPERIPLQWVGRTSRALICAHEKGFVLADIKRLGVHLETRALLNQWNNQAWKSTALSIPCIIRFSEAHQKQLEKHQLFLESWGFVIELFGEGDYALKARPSFIAEAIAERLLCSILTSLSSSGVHNSIPLSAEAFIFLMVSECSRLENRLDQHSNFELTAELARVWKTPSLSPQIFLEVPYQQLESRGN